MARKPKVEFPGGRLSSGAVYVLLREDEWTALQWMRFLFSKPRSAIDDFLREIPIAADRADDLVAWAAHVRLQSGEPVSPLRLGRGGHLELAVRALLSRSPEGRRAGPSRLRDVPALARALSSLVQVARRAPEEGEPATAVSAMTLRRAVWDVRWSGEAEGPLADDSAIAELEARFPGIREEQWSLVLDECRRIEVDAAVTRTPALERLQRAAPGFPDDVYREAIELGRSSWTGD